MEIIAEYLNYLENEQLLSFNSLRLYKRDLLDFEAFVSKEIRVDDYNICNLDPKTLELFKQWIEKQGKSIASINRKLTALHGLWTWLRNASRVKGDPFTQVEREAQYRNKTFVFLTEEEMQELLDCGEHSLRSKIILELIYATGIRVGELLSLTLEDVDLDNQLISIPHSAKYKSRVVPFNKLLKEYLLTYIHEHNLKLGHKLFFTNSKASGEEVSAREIFRLVKQAGIKAGLERKISPSIIRNSFIQHMKDRGAFKALLRDLTGQKTV